MAGKGRPSTFSAEIAAVICGQLAEGQSLRSICKAEDMPPESTVRGWVVDNVDGFAAQYTRARDLGLDAVADELLDIADDGTNDWMERNSEGNPGWAVNGEHVQRSRLRLDARKWYLSKLAPKKYGDKVQQEITGADGGPIQTQDVSELTPVERAQRLAAILAAGRTEAGGSITDAGCDGDAVASDARPAKSGNSDTAKAGPRQQG